MIPLLQAKNPCEIEGRNFKRHYTEPSIGKVYRLSFEVDKETWDACELIPKTALIKGILWWEADEELPQPGPHPEENCVDSECPIHGTREPKPKEPKGPYSYYWEQLFRHGFNNFPDLIEVLECAGDQVRLRLHDVFNVPSLSQVSPEQFEQWCESENLISLITLSRQARLAVAA